MDATKKLSYTYDEAAAAVGVSSRTIRQLVADGDLTAKYIGRKPVIKATELSDWLDTLPSEPVK